MATQWGVLFTNQHAYPVMAQYYNGLARLDQIDWAILQRRDFEHDPDDPGKKERYQAATVDWLLSMGSSKPTLESVRAGLRSWLGGRSAGEQKLRLFDDRLMSLALARLAPDSGA